MDYGSVSFSESDSAGALEELDRGLRSDKIGDQCGAVAKLPFLLERYPFPLFINSSILKVAEVFKLGSNLLRNIIVKVAERSEKHLHKLTSVDEVLKRIFAVSHSNDPEARSLTLRLLGYMASLFAQKKSVHHLLSNSFESRDYEELLAAIQASQYYAKYSSEFSHGILEKVEQVLTSLETPVQTKIRLIPIFRHMHSHAGDVKRVMELCKAHLLVDCPNVGLRVLTLNILTELASKSQLILHEQIHLLLGNLRNDSSSKIQTAILKNLRILAKHSPHIWTSDDVKYLADFCANSPRVECQSLSLDTFVHLTDKKTCAVWLQNYSQEFLPLIFCFVSDASVQLAMKGTKTLTNISGVLHSNGRIEDTTMIDDKMEVDALLSLLSKINCRTTSIVTLQKCLKLAIIVTLKSPTKRICLVKALLSLVENSENAAWKKEILISLATLAEKCPDLYPDLTVWAYQRAENLDSDAIIIELGNFLIPPKYVVSPDLISKKELDRILGCQDFWKMYQFGRKGNFLPITHC